MALLALLSIFVFFVLPIILIVWFKRLIKLYKKRQQKRKSFYFQSIVFSLILIVFTWNLRIFPFSINYHRKEQTKRLTGKPFWTWKKFSLEEINAKGKEYSIDIFRFSDETAKYFKNPNKDFFEKYPIVSNYRISRKEEKWKKTPIPESDIDFLERATPIYGNWSQYKKDKMSFVLELANKQDGYYAYSLKNGAVNFFILSPECKLLIIISNNL